MEENGTTDPEKETATPAGSGNATPDLGKFKSVDALLRAYGELEAEFTRRSQRLKALEERGEADGNALPPQGAAREEELYRAVNENEGVRARILSDYLASLKGVPLMAASGAGVPVPKSAPKSISEAGAYALRFLRGNKN